MTLRRKILITFVVATAVFLGALYLIMSATVRSRMWEVDQAECQRDVERVLAALNAEADYLDQVAFDWGTWDDSYRFITDHNAAFITSNFTDSSFTSLKVDYIVFVDLKGRVVFAKGFDYQIRKPLSVPDALLGALKPDSPLVRLPAPDSHARGVVVLNDVAYLIASRAICTSESQGPVRGAVIMARVIDTQEVKGLHERTKLGVSVSRWDDPQLSAESRETESWLAAGGAPVIKQPAERMMAGYGVARDIYGQPALLVEARDERHAYAATQVMLRQLVLMLIGGILVFGVLLMVGLEHSVLRRVTQLSDETARIGAGGDLSARVSETMGRDEIGTLIHGVNRMLGDLEYAQVQRQEGIERYRAVVEQAREGICVIDADTKQFLEANEALHRILGFPTGALLSMTVYELSDADRADTDALFATWTQQEQYSAHSWSFPRRDGTATSVEAGISPITYSGREALCVLVRDVSERVRVEQERAALQDALQQSQRLRAVGQLAAGMAHNFNNLLTTVLGNLQLAQPYADPQTVQFLERAEGAVLSAADIVRRFALFSRTRTSSIGPVSVPEIITEVVDICRQTFSRRIEIRTGAPEDLPPVLGDPGRIHELLLSLCLNARDALLAVPSDGRMLRLDVTAALQVIPAGGSAARPGARPGTFVRLTVADVGIGMDRETQERMYEPFFTTKQVGQGVGLGLSTAYGIVEQHGGWMECHSAVGEGTTIDVYLPVVSPSDPPANAPSPGAPQGRGETILFVDDEPEILAIGKQTLESNGYRVLLAHDGPEALALFEQHRAQIALVALDFAMPTMSGAQVKERLLALAPETRIVMCSGDLLSEADLAGTKASLNKPFRLEEMLSTMRRVLEA